MAQTAQQLRDNRMADANKGQQDIQKSLENILNTLDDRREKELDRLVKKMGEAQKELDQLRKEQQDLLKKTREANKMQDPQQKKDTLKRLSKQQAELRKKMDDLARRLSKMRAGRAAEQTDAANARLGQAEQNMVQGNGDAAEQDMQDADKQLEEAANGLNRQRKRRKPSLPPNDLPRLQLRSSN